MEQPGLELMSVWDVGLVAEGFTCYTVMLRLSLFSCPRGRSAWQCQVEVPRWLLCVVHTWLLGAGWERGVRNRAVAVAVGPWR